MTPEQADDIISEHGWREARILYGLDPDGKVVFGPPNMGHPPDRSDRPFARALARIEQDFAQ